MSLSVLRLVRVKLLSVSLVALLLASPLAAVAAGGCTTGGCVQWTATPSSTSSLVDSAIAPDGANVYTTSYAVGANGRSDYLTRAYVADTGAVSWSATWDGAASSVDNVRAVVATDSKVIVAGTSQNRLVTYPDNEYLAQDVAVVAYDAVSGSQAWASRHNGAPNLEEMTYGLTVSPDGARAFVVGRTQVGSDFFRAHDALIIAYDTTNGAQLWRATLAGSANDQDSFYAVAASADSAVVYAAGVSVNTGFGQDMQVAAYDAATGARLWSRTYTGAVANSNDAAMDIAVAGSRVVVTGPSGNNGFATVAIDAATGAQSWATRGTSSGMSALAASADGDRVFAIGGIYGSSGYPQTLVVAYDAATGSEAWRRQYSTDTYSIATDVETDATGTRVYVGDYVYDEYFQSTGRVRALDAATGSAAWSASLDYWSGVGLVVSPDAARVVATGGQSGREGLVAYASGVSLAHHELHFTPSKSHRTTGATDGAVFPLALYNDGNVAEAVTLTLDGPNAGWTATLTREGESTPLTDLVLAAGERANLTLRVTADATTLSGRAWVNVTATSADASARTETETTKSATYPVELPPPVRDAVCFAGDVQLPSFVCRFFGWS